ncbi:CCA tRNA nucleotidyltransferase [Peribacillus sp. SCS-155]|uniref:CCA tRNA nucleotidyltransferase n=1 Tax=Peribacillus sedimenti TaxID=3115297 RepID=UPI00390603B7
MNDLFAQAVPIIKLLEKAGYEAYFVGGSVRDYLMNKSIHDVDIATSATPQEVKAIFGKTVDVGIEHGTVIVLHRGKSYEVTTFRTESGYSDFRRPDHVEFVRSLEEDLKRRDFTINAIAMKSNGEVIDPMDGRKDIHNRLLVTVGDPDERFREDALRMMRAVRFISQLDFELDKETFESLQNNGYMLKNIAVERIYTEFEKLLTGISINKAIHLLAECGLFKYLPGLARMRDSLENFAKLPLKNAGSTTELWALLMVFSEEQDIEKFLRAWKMPVKQIREIQSITTLVRNWPIALKEKHPLFYAGELAVKSAKVFDLVQGGDTRENETYVREWFSRLPLKNMSELAVNGSDLLSWYKRQPGPWVKDELQFIIEGILNARVSNEKEEIKEWLSFCGRM